MDSHYYIYLAVLSQGARRRAAAVRRNPIVLNIPKWRALPGEITVVILCIQCSLCNHSPMGKSENNRECNDTTNGLFTSHGAPQGRKNDIWERANRFLNGKSTILQWEIYDSVVRFPKFRRYAAEKAPARAHRARLATPPPLPGSLPGCRVLKKCIKV